MAKHCAPSRHSRDPESRFWAARPHSACTCSNSEFSSSTSLLLAPFVCCRLLGEVVRYSYPVFFTFKLLVWDRLNFEVGDGDVEHTFWVLRLALLIWLKMDRIVREPGRRFMCSCWEPGDEKFPGDGTMVYESSREHEWTISTRKTDSKLQSSRSFMDVPSGGFAYVSCKLPISGISNTIEALSVPTFSLNGYTPRQNYYTWIRTRFFGYPYNYYNLSL